MACRSWFLRGVERCPEAEGEAYGLLIEPRGTVNTVDAGGSVPPSRSICDHATYDSLEAR